MSAVPTSPLAPADLGYSDVYDMWTLQGSASFVEDQGAGWLRAVIFPDGGAQPTFVLLCSTPGMTTTDLDSGVTGLGLEMAVRQRSYRPRGTLPKEAV